jgi:hypothetical protein
MRARSRSAIALLLVVYFLPYVGADLPSFHTCSLHDPAQACGRGDCDHTAIRFSGENASAESDSEHECLACHLQAVGKDSNLEGRSTAGAEEDYGECVCGYAGHDLTSACIELPDPRAPPFNS